jgi:hypothetical protein
MATFGDTGTPNPSNFNWSGINTQNVVYDDLGAMPATGLVTQLHVYMGGHGGDNPSTILFMESFVGGTNTLLANTSSFNAGTGVGWQVRGITSTLVLGGTNTIGVGFYASPGSGNERQWNWNSVGGNSWYYSTNTGSFSTPPRGSQVASQQMGAYMDYTPVSLYGWDGSAWQASSLFGDDGSAEQASTLLAYDGTTWQTVGKVSPGVYRVKGPPIWTPRTGLLSRLAEQDPLTCIGRSTLWFGTRPKYTERQAA